MDGCKDGLDTDQDGSSVSNGAAPVPFCANGAHPSYTDVLILAIIFFRIIRVVNTRSISILFPYTSP